MSAIRFFLDEHMAHALVHPLNGAGITCITTASVGRTGATDESHIEWCLERGLTIITNDSDFLDLATRGVPHAGIGWAHESKYSIGGLVDRLIRLHGEKSAEEIRDWLEYL